MEGENILLKSKSNGRLVFLMQKSNEHKLDNPEFLEISDTKNGSVKYFGGNQSWFPRPQQVYGGCAPTSAANIYKYMFLPTTQFNQTEYLALMQSVYLYVRPLEIPFTQLSLGFFSFFGFVQSFKRFVSDSQNNGVRLKANVLRFRTKTNKQKAIEFICEALDKNCPVALLTMFVFQNAKMQLCCGHDLGSYQKYDKHWVTITQMFMDPSGRWQCIVSSWGEQYQMDFDAFFENINVSNLILPSGVVYFEIVPLTKPKT